MKKILLLCFFFLVLFTLSTCASAPTPEPVPDYEDEMAESEGFPDDLFVPDLSNTYNEDLVAAFTPDDAYIHSDIESMLVLKSEKSMTDLIAFCLAAADKLGIKQTAIDDENPGLWTYDGTLDDLAIHVELRDDGGSVNLMLLY